jgi:hypothetical protein
MWWNKWLARVVWAVVGGWFGMKVKVKGAAEA